MAKAKLAVTMDEQILAEVDSLVRSHRFPNRSRVIELAVREKLDRLSKSRLADQCSLLDPTFEQSMAEEGIGEEIDQWPAY
ncbi:putative nickel-responsive regulator [Geobacter sp. OR-1]|uniref:ribbon-helix-helix domain-containing protein n=1 Tax=Geobacter sp. OR-1 TaxID=1266765 RepID=UPI00054407C1|nr:ribbon-helix-helix domain-containing protein [Geobacter sp. OR-1]GAM10680.1 putative nickel-responsive regulator [Geobacter sp. OR-1]